MLDSLSFFAVLRVISKQKKKQQRLKTGHTVSNIYIFHIYFPFTA